MGKLIDLSGLAAAMTRMGQAARNTAYAPGDRGIRGVNPDNWPSAGQPVQPLNPGAASLIWPFLYGQNLTFTPRPDATYTSGELQMLATYPLARICIDNTKDALCSIPWSIELRKMPGESDAEVKKRRQMDTKGDSNITKLSEMFEWPDGQHDWSEWLRPIVEDMLVLDAASTLIQRTRIGKITGFEWTSGAPISVYIDDRGKTPQAPDPAYAQTWQGAPRIDLSTDQLVYKPRNIVPRGSMISSYLYGYGPVESVADEVKVGMGRLAFVMAYYEAGSLGNMIHVVPPGVPPDKVKEAMQWVNSELAGNYANRRQYRIIQGFQEEGKQDQVIFPAEPVLADVFDDLLIRKLCFAFGTSPQRLLKQMNRASAQTSQTGAQEEGIRPWMDWVRRLVNFLIQRKLKMTGYEMVFSPYFESDYLKKAKADAEYVKEGVVTRNEVRDDLGRDPSENPMANELCITTPNGTVKLGDLVISGKPGDGPTGNPKPTPAPKPAAKAAELPMTDGVPRLIERGVE